MKTEYKIKSEEIDRLKDEYATLEVKAILRKTKEAKENAKKAEEKLDKARAEFAEWVYGK